MKILRFTLSGKTAFFKKPEVNSYYYFTYGNIHKVALLGLFGAVLGYGGYNQMSQEGKKKKALTQGYPEFYEKLEGLKISIVPNAPKGFFHKKVQIFNNSVGYASKEQGGNLIIKEQWIEEPSWDIHVLIQSEEGEKLSKALQSRQCVYSPYLGKNDHYADIKNVQIEECKKREIDQGILNCLFPAELISLSGDLYDDEDETEVTYKYQEKLPYQLDAWTNNYLTKSFVFTDGLAEWGQQDIYEFEGRNLIFY